MSDITSVLLDRVLGSENRLARLETQEGDYYSRSEADSLFVTYDYANDNFIDISAYGDFLLATGQATGALIFTQVFDHGIEARDGVWGGGGANDDLILEGTSHATKTSSYVLLQPNGGKVGIGTSAPGAYLELNIPDDLRPGGTAARSNVFRFQGGQGASIWGQRWNFDVMGYADTTASKLIIAAGNNSTGSFTTSDLITIVSNGSVGLGVTAPAYKLDVNGIVNVRGDQVIFSGGSGLGADQADSTATLYNRASVGLTASSLRFIVRTGSSAPSERLRVDESGKVGIGTTSPDQQLHVAGALALSGASNALKVYDRTNGASKAFGMYVSSNIARIYSWGAPGDVMAFNESGNVGIGNTPNTSRLFVDGSGDTAIQVNTTSASNLPRFIFGNATRYWDLFINGTGGQFMLRDISAGNLTRIAVDLSGNVGIGGITSPAARIHANSGSTNYDASLTYGATAGYIFNSAALDLAMGVQSTSPYAFWMQVRSTANTAFPIALNPLGGNVGIGTTNPGTKLHIEDGDVLISNNRWYYGRNSSGTLIRLAGIDGSNNVYLGAIDNAGGKVVIREDASDVITLTGGSVGIGTSSPDAKLEVQVNSGGAINAIEVTQEDTNRAFINFVSTDVASSGTHLVNTAAVGTYYGKIKVAVNGTYYFIPVYNT